MRLLVITQVVNKNDTNLGFFHEWLKRLAAQVEELHVVCLFKGEQDLPRNVKIISLGKEAGRANRFLYALRFYKALWQLRGQYDGVFVHMNPEYIVLAGWLWRLMDKKVLLWYTHKAVNLKLRIATLFANKIFTASKESFRLPSKKVEVVDHGIPSAALNYLSVKEHRGLEGGLALLSVGRISPNKDLETSIRAAEKLRDKKLEDLKWIRFIFAGAALKKEEIGYRDYLKELCQKIMSTVKNPPLSFSFESYPYEQIFNVYQNNHILIHTSRTGSMDKVVLEALAAGRIVITSSEAYASLADGKLKGVVFRFPPGDYRELANAIEKIWKDGLLNSIPNQRAIEYVRQHHNLNNIVQKIVSYFAQN